MGKRGLSQSGTGIEKLVDKINEIKKKIYEIIDFMLSMRDVTIYSIISIHDFILYIVIHEVHIFLEEPKTQNGTPQLEKIKLTGINGNLLGTWNYQVILNDI